MFAADPFWCHARKWCPPSDKVSASLVCNWTKRRTDYALPACPKDGKVCLAGQELLVAPPLAIAEVGLVDIPEM